MVSRKQIAGILFVTLFTVFISTTTLNLNVSVGQREAQATRAADIRKHKEAIRAKAADKSAAQRTRDKINQTAPPVLCDDPNEQPEVCTIDQPLGAVEDGKPTRFWTRKPSYYNVCRKGIQGVAPVQDEGYWDGYNAPTAHLVVWCQR